MTEKLDKEQFEKLLEGIDFENAEEAEPEIDEELIYEIE